jgi:hypothetical protein
MPEFQGRGIVVSLFVVPPSGGSFETATFRINAGLRTQKAISLTHLCLDDKISIELESNHDFS